MPDVSPSLQTHRFLQTAEMVKPSTPSPSHESSSTAGSDEGTEYYPHLGESRSGARAMGKRDLGSALILGKGTEGLAGPSSLTHTASVSWASQGCRNKPWVDMGTP